MNIIEWYKKTAKWTNQYSVDTHVHMTIGALIQMVHLYFGIHFAGIVLALVIGVLKEELMDKKFNIKDALDYPFGALLVYFGGLLW